ncbi:hypothetical protein F5X99DRAFT_422003 [Biscogniauxia marginata]|nr:hypothetical protein F5X99DRAFT_422003 [Biscogniauxia marginata]
MPAPPKRATTKEEDQDQVPSTSAAADAARSGAENAIDDTEYLSDDLANANQIISNDRRRRQSQLHAGIQGVLPFPWSPLLRPMTISDIESCIALENAAFPNPAHRCSRDKFEYRLTVCPELSMGIFCTVPGNAKDFEIDTLRTAKPVETGRNNGAVSVLLAHVVSTRSTEDVITDNAMDYPRDFKTNRRNTSHLGHQEFGRTICIHSLAVDPKLQGCGMGKLILKAFLQQVKNSALASRVSLICQEYLVDYYIRFGFEHLGPSKAAFGGGGWHDMDM